jgi:hypothetical protein
MFFWPKETQANIWGKINSRVFIPKNPGIIFHITGFHGKIKRPRTVLPTFENCPSSIISKKVIFTLFSSFLAKAGIQLNQEVLDSRLRGSDGFSDFLRVHQV